MAELGNITRGKIPSITEFRRLRRRKGINQTKLGVLIGRSQNFISQVEIGHFDTKTQVFQYSMIVLEANPFEILRCLKLNPFDESVVARFEKVCRQEGKDPTKVLELLMRFYARPKVKTPDSPGSQPRKE